MFKSWTHIQTFSVTQVNIFIDQVNILLWLLLYSKAWQTLKLQSLRHSQLIYLWSITLDLEPWNWVRTEYMLRICFPSTNKCWQYTGFIFSTTSAIQISRCLEYLCCVWVRQSEANFFVLHGNKWFFWV